MTTKENLQPLGAQNFLALNDVDATNYTGKAGMVFIVNSTSTGLEPIALPDVPTVVGTGTQFDIPIFNDPLSAPPVFNDSGMAITNFSVPPSFEAKILDCNSSYPLTNTIVSVRDTITNENQMIVGVTGINEDSDLIIGNQSNTSKFLGIINSSPNGDMFITSENVSISDNFNNSISVSQSSGIGLFNLDNAMTLNNSDITLYNNNGTNTINMNVAGNFINSNVQVVQQCNANSITTGTTDININGQNDVYVNAVNQILLQDSTGDNIQVSPNVINVISPLGDININGSNNVSLYDSVGNAIGIQSSLVSIKGVDETDISGFNRCELRDTSGDYVRCTPGQIFMNGDQIVTINENTDAHFLSMNAGGVILASNSGKPLTLATDNELRIKASSSFGTTNQVLTASGTGFCSWQDVAVMNQTMYRLTNFLPNGSSTGPLRIMNESGQVLVLSGTSNNTNSICYLRIDPSDYPATIGNKVARLQLVHNVITNGTAPACNFTSQLYTYTSSGASTSMTITASGAFGNSATVITPPSLGTTSASSLPFTFPVSATNYVLVLTNSAITASFTHHSIYLKVVYV